MRPRLFLHVMGMEARRRMSYRADFWVNALAGFAAEFGIVWFLWKAMYAESHRHVIAGYDLDHVLVYYVVVILFGKLVRGSEFDAQVSADIYEGGLNRYLVWPAPYFGLKYAQHLGGLLPALVQLALFGGLWALLGGARGWSGVSPIGVGMCLVSLVVANVLYYLLTLPLHAVAFWADNVWSLLVGMRFLTALLGGLLFPLALFPPAVRSLNDWLPFRGLFSLPAETLLGRVGPEAWMQATAVSLGWVGLLALVATVVWRRGDLQYSGVGI